MPLRSHCFFSQVLVVSHYSDFTQ